ncbi:hypothetical protein GBAR_LOCUS14446, partial [Geodia barretti]
MQLVSQRRMTRDCFAGRTLPSAHVVGVRRRGSE